MAPLRPEVLASFAPIHPGRGWIGFSARAYEGLLQLFVLRAPLLISLLSLTLSGCFARGILYTDTVSPLCTDARMTSLGTTSAASSSKKIQIPTVRIDFTAEWDSRAIGDIAKKHGITTVYGCDARTKSYVLGIWREDSVIIYGD